MANQDEFRYIYDIHDLGSSIREAIKLIRIFQEKNNLKFKLSLKIDFTTVDCGYYYHNVSKKTAKIFINPLKCQSKMKQGFEKHPEDYSMCATILHEIGHFIQDIFLNKMKEFKSICKKDKIYLTRYSKRCKNIDEEFAETFMLFMLNPYLLKIISKERYNWLKNLFKSPTRCGKKTFEKFKSVWSLKALDVIIQRFPHVIEKMY